MRTLKCDICGKKLNMDESGEFAICEFCGVKHTRERMQAKEQQMKEKAMKKKKRLKVALVILGVVLLVLLCIPIKYVYKDGGTVKYQAGLWSYTMYHSLQPNGEYHVDEAFAIFPFNLFY